MHDTTNTLDRILQLEDEYLQRSSTAELDDEDRWRCIEIRRIVDSLWPKRRAELVYERHGPPLMISAPDPSSCRAVMRAIAHGIAPLPMPATGGD
jgi:hypothetical protein